jgi:arylsulfatase A-like enzyme
MYPNVLLLIMDSVRARNVGLYGHYHETTPRLSEFADGATVYHQARAPAIWSLPSHASIFTGLEVPEHRITGEEDKLKPDTSIWETLQDDYGYRAGLFTGNRYIAGAKHGLNRGFEDIGESPTFEDYPFEGTSPSEFYRKHGHPPSSVEYLRYSFGSEYPLQSVGNGFVGKFDGLVERVAPNLQPTYPNRGRELADQFLTWVGRVDEPWAVCMNFGDAHTPYRPEEPHDKWGGGAPTSRS